MKKASDLRSIADILSEKIEKAKNTEVIRSGIHEEFQDYAYRLAHQLGDLDHKSIYFRISKSYPRAVIQDAASFALTYTNVPNKGKLFMWRLRELYKEYKLKHPEHKLQSTKKKSPRKKAIKKKVEQLDLALEK
jgi:hypothetical protein